MILNNCIHLLYFYFLLLLLIKQALNAQSVLNIRYFYFSKANKQRKKKINKSNPPLFLSNTDSEERV